MIHLNFLTFYRLMVWYENLTTGMAFVDELIHLNQDLTVILVDKRAQPGGHWGSFFTIKIDTDSLDSDLNHLKSSLARTRQLSESQYSQ